ncbi:MAG: WxL domain-containing protein, partial [Streptococcaceae bacterium]|nr:WxL domain-containing protein [Streptococcaceae bacterium]
LAAATLGTMAIGATSASAATVAMTTPGKVSFTQSTTTNPEIIDPTNPTVITPTTPTTPKGALDIDYASDFDFGNHAVSYGTSKTYEALLDEVVYGDGTHHYTSPFVAVHDERGTFAGWNLTVKNTPFTASTTTSTALGGTLTGATVKVINTSVKSGSTDMAYAPSNAGFTIDGTGAAQNVMAAQTDKGMGAWTYVMGASTDVTNPDTATGTTKGVTLNIPSSAMMKAEIYTSTITWTLADTPTGTV